jgi:hypothetical protein
LRTLPSSEASSKFIVGCNQLDRSPERMECDEIHLSPMPKALVADVNGAQGFEANARRTAARSEASIGIGSLLHPDARPGFRQLAEALGTAPNC